MDRIEPEITAVRLPPGPEVLAALEEAWAAGGAVATIDPDLPRPAVDALARRLRPSWWRDADGARPLEGGAPAPPGTALVMPTSGTTGEPKLVCLPHAAVEASVAASLDRLGAREDDRWLCCVPTHHVAGLAVLLRARALGGQARVHPRFEAARVTAEPGVTHVSLVPTQLGRLLDAGADLSRFRAILVGGGPAPPGLLERARAAGAPIVTTYGLTETFGGCVYDGAPLDGVEAAVGDDGLIRLRGAVVCAGYLRDPERTAAAFDGDWLVTADRGRWQDGRLVVDGRDDDVVVTGGENVSADAVADALLRHPGVADAAVAGVDDAGWGRAVAAWCVAADDPPPGTAELRAHVAGLLGRAAAPQRVRWVARLPRTALGKVARDELPPIGDTGT